VIALGGDVPPDLSPGELARVPMALVARGERDEWQTAAKLQADQARLRAAGVDVSSLQFDGGHEWTPDFSRAAGEFLRRFD
jgi:predicted esterase